MAGAGNQNYHNQHDATDDRTELILSFHCRGDGLESRLQTSRFTIQQRLVALRRCLPTQSSGAELAEDSAGFMSAKLKWKILTLRHFSSQ